MPQATSIAARDTQFGRCSGTGPASTLSLSDDRRPTSDSQQKREGVQGEEEQMDVETMLAVDELEMLEMFDGDDAGKPDPTSDPK